MALPFALSGSGLDDGWTPAFAGVTRNFSNGLA